MRDDQGSRAKDVEDDRRLAEALRRCAQGDRSALRMIFDAESGRLLAMAERILGRRDLAEEALQEGMVRVWRRAGQYGGRNGLEDGSARGWINAVVRNAALTQLRKDSRQPVSLDDAAIETIANADLAASADAAIAALDASSRLRVCLDALDPSKRACVLMAYLFGYTHGEIAGRIGAPLGTVKAWVRRGLAALRECLQ